MFLILKHDTFEKNYLINTSEYEYESLLSLVFELFSSHHFEDREAELYLYQMLKDTGYPSIEAIPIQQLNSIVNYFLKHRDTYKVDYDEERLTYLLLAAIKEKQILTIIDKKLIEDIQKPLSLKKDSSITFFKMNKLNSIKFKSL